MDRKTTPVKPRILVVDDDQDILDVVRMALEEDGMEVVTASTAREALQTYDRHWREIDLVLLDYVLTDMLGDLVFDCLMRINPYAKVLMLTGCDDRVGDRLMDIGLRGVITKPFYLDEMVTRVREELNSL